MPDYNYEPAIEYFQTFGLDSIKVDMKKESYASGETTTLYVEGNNGSTNQLDLRREPDGTPAFTFGMWDGLRLGFKRSNTANKASLEVTISETKLDAESNRRVTFQTSSTNEFEKWVSVYMSGQVNKDVLFNTDMTTADSRRAVLREFSENDVRPVSINL